MPAAAEVPELPLHYRVMWGVLPLSALVFAVAASTASLLLPPGSGSRPRRRFSPMSAVESRLQRAARLPDGEPIGTISWKAPVQRILENLRPSDRSVRIVGLVMAVGLIVPALVGIGRDGTNGPAEVAIAYYDDLDFRRFQDAWERLDSAARPSLSEYLVQLSVQDGLLASYASLDEARVVDVAVVGDRATVEVGLTYVTALAEYHSTESVALRRTGDAWGIVLPAADGGEPVERLARRAGIEFLPMGRRTATSATTDYDDVLDRPELEVAAPRMVLFDGHPVAVGSVMNVDADPAAVTITAQMLDEAGEVAAVYNAARVMQHSLLPGESSSFRVDFEGVAGRVEAGYFDPADFVPVAPIADLAGLDVYAKATVTGRGLGRPVVVQDLRVSLDPTGSPQLDGSILNLGVADATVVALLVSLYDTDRRLIWVDWVIVSDAVRPGLTASFTAPLTSRDRLSPLDVASQVFGNGLATPPATIAPPGMIEMPAASGYAGLTVQPVTFLRSAGA
jgi:hypothetical protein